MQTVREIRDKSIEKANQEWYQIQRGRRALDQEPVDRTPMSSMKRADLVLHQNSYNLEVSVLSGMAKYVGFPAAPEVTGASQAEMDEDLRKMGVCISDSTMSEHKLTCSDLTSTTTAIARVLVNIAVPPAELGGGKTIQQGYAMGECAASASFVQPQRPATMERHHWPG